MITAFQSILCSSKNISCSEYDNRHLFCIFSHGMLPATVQFEPLRLKPTAVEAIIQKILSSLGKAFSFLVGHAINLFCAFGFYRLGRTEVISIASHCPSCNALGDSLTALTDIPHFKEVFHINHSTKPHLNSITLPVPTGNYNGI